MNERQRRIVDDCKLVCVQHLPVYSSQVMSDEFNVEGRTFADGDDRLWTALDKPDNDANAAGGGSLHFYNSSAVRTSNGMLEINTYKERTAWNHYDKINKKWKNVKTNFTSGMVQSWNKFCFTGGIVEVDIIFPGDPAIGGLWPAVWMLGNLGRATYEASTNNIWPWSYNVCDREKQDAQSISACNRIEHYGLHPFQGRGATEIDLVEVMTGTSNGPLPGTSPPVSLPYADMTLQVAPGVPKNRPQSGSAPIRKTSYSKTGHTEFAAQTWYEGLEMHGNTSINPFFYGTFLGQTKPNEPVQRTEKQAFQADAIGAAHQLTEAHFLTSHTFRIEWQPGPGGRIDWYSRGGTKVDVNGTEKTLMMDGNGTEWIHAYSIKDESLSELMGSQIPIEPTYLILNTAISSTWGFPFDAVRTRGMIYKHESPWLLPHLFCFCLPLQRTSPIGAQCVLIVTIQSVLARFILDFVECSQRASPCISTRFACIRVETIMPTWVPRIHWVVVSG